MASNVSYEGTATIKDCDIPYQVAFAPADLTIPPVEEILLQVGTTGVPSNLFYEGIPSNLF